VSEHLYLLGHHIKHSKSPDMYNAVYAQWGLPWTYSLADISSEKNAERFLERGEYLALNITTPYKSLAYKAADRRSSSAVLARGANILTFARGEKVVYDTDGRGFVRYLKRLGFGFNGARIAICGTGPTARAIMHASALEGAREVSLVSRSFSNAQQVLEDYKANLDYYEHTEDDEAYLTGEGLKLNEVSSRVSFLGRDYDELKDVLSQVDLVVNATPLGMKRRDPAPFDTSLINSNQVAFDVVYGHGETAFVAGAKSQGAKVLDGSGMLVGQAVATIQVLMHTTQYRMLLSEDDLFDFLAKAAGFNLKL
jgi:shikimate dehydrogenase